MNEVFGSAVRDLLHVVDESIGYWPALLIAAFLSAVAIDQFIRDTGSTFANPMRLVRVLLIMAALILLVDVTKEPVLEAVDPQYAFEKEWCAFVGTCEDDGTNGSTASNESGDACDLVLSRNKTLTKTTCVRPDGGRYDGDVRDGRLEGWASIDYANGDRYYGEVQYGRPQGQGAMTYPDGGRYLGAFALGRPFGEGTLVQSDGKVVTGHFE